MARYDRIAVLPLPTRDSAFPGWGALADLDGCERDADLGRRARLRYLVLRPVHRLLELGCDGVPRDSYQRQVDGIREELGQLSMRDPERLQLSDFLSAIRDPAGERVVAALVELGDASERRGSRHAAEELYREAVDLSRSAGLPAERVLALRHLGALLRRVGQLEEAEALHRRAMTLAYEFGLLEAWGRAVAGLACVLRDRGRPAEAREQLEVARARGRDWDEPAVVAAAAVVLSEIETADGEPERALESAWDALQQVRDGGDRDALLGRVGAAFAALGMERPAVHCFELLAASASEPRARVAAAAARAGLAADAGDAAAFRARRESLLRELGEWSEDGRLLAGLHLGLGRAALRIGDADDARGHVRAALEAAEGQAAADLLREAETLLSVLERAAAEAEAEAERPRPGEIARRIEGALGSLSTAGGAKRH